MNKWHYCVTFFKFYYFISLLRKKHGPAINKSIKSIYWLQNVKDEMVINNTMKNPHIQRPYQDLNSDRRI